MLTSETERTPRALKARKQTVLNIQALRGVAILLVIWAHLKFPLELLSPATAQMSVFRNWYGAVGVDIFFVISGYVICLSACERHRHPLEFFLARIARISPLYLVAFLPAVLLLPPSLRGAAFLGDSPMGHSLWNGLFYLPVFDLKDYTEPPLVVGWTLSFEMWFYIAFALLLNFWAPKKVAFMLPLIFGIGAIGMTFYSGAWYFPRFMFHPFVLIFAFGCLVYQMQRWVNGRLAWSLVVLGVVCFGMDFILKTTYLGENDWELSARIDLAWLRVLAWGLPSAFLVAGLIGLERHYGYVFPRGLVWMGEISYSLYLSHVFSILIVTDICQRAGLHNAAAIVPSLVLFTIFFGWFCWKFIEKPLTSRAQRAVKRLFPDEPSSLQDSNRLASGRAVVS